MRWVGVDPGVNGGAVCLEPDGRTVVWAVGWRRRKRKAGTVWAVSMECGGSTEWLTRTLGGVARCVGDMAAFASPYCLSVEGLFGRGPSLVVLSEASGRMLGPLEDASSGKTWRPRSQAWRGRVLGISERRLGAKVSEDYAVNLAPTMFEGLGELVTDGHVVEAACIALDGLRCDGGAR